MNIIKPSGTREQLAVIDWLNHAASIRSDIRTTADAIPSILPYFDYLTHATASFGRCELIARSFDRAVVLDLYKDRQKSFASDVKKYNEIGLAQLENIRKVLPSMTADIKKYDFNPKKVASRLDDGVKELRLAIADWEMKGSDAKKIDVVLTEMVTEIKNNGLESLPSYLDKKFTELREIRLRDDRGAIDNIPWWKIMIIVGFLGWWVLDFLHCGIFGCQPAVNTFYKIVQAIHLLAFILFC